MAELVPTSPEAGAPSRRRGPGQRLLDLFSSIRLGVTLLSLLFIYSSIGSAGAPIGAAVLQPPFILSPEAWRSVREMRPFEMTEFEWFHWWPFDLLIALICLNLIVATIRRIPFRIINLGVLMIHSGIIILSVGSVWYFTTKIEGDSPVTRRAVVVQAPGLPPQQFIARPGNGIAMNTAQGRYEFLISSIDPQWELLSGEDVGKKAYAVTVSVRTPQRTFQRQVIAGYPQYTEDIVRTENPQQPFARAKKVNPDGNPLVDASVDVSLRYVAQPWVYLMESSAVYVRNAGAKEWSQRVIDDLPRYNNYVTSMDDVFPAPSTAPIDQLKPDPLNIHVKQRRGGDALGDEPLSVTGYLRFANIETRQTSGGDAINPAVAVELRDQAGRVERIDLLAFDPTRNVAGNPDARGIEPLHLRWFDTAAAFDAYMKTAPPRLRVVIPDDNIDIEHDLSGLVDRDNARPWQTVEGSDWQFRVVAVPENLPLDSGERTSLAIVEYRENAQSSPTTRWVFDDALRTRDRAAEADMTGNDPEHGMRPPDARIQMQFDKSQQLPLMTIAAGPDARQLRLILAKPDEPVQVSDLAINQPVRINDAVSLAVTSYAARTVEETKPAIVARANQAKGVRRMASMIQVHVPGAADPEPIWLPYHEYPFEAAEDVLLRFPYEPTTVRLHDGREVELLFSRARIPLPDPVVLEDFQIASHVGGFTGASSSIRNWTSIVRFQTDDGWSERRAVSVNEPIAHGGFWYFQASWDPPVPEANSAGLNFTILGVGNRNGVYVQLTGCCIAVLGMLFAFYVKPVLKRRRQRAAYAEVAAMRHSGSRPTTSDEPLHIHTNGVSHAESKQ